MIAKDFANEGMSPFSQPEFTQMELYVAYKDYRMDVNLVKKWWKRLLWICTEQRK